MFKYLYKCFAFFSILLLTISLNPVPRSDNFLSTFSKTASAEASERTPPSKERFSNLYSPYFIRLMQIVFESEGIISQGGVKSAEVMFKDIKLEGKKILDVGCGFGGVELYFAQKYPLEIVGVDREPYMILQAEKFLEKEQPFLLGHVTFQVLQDPTSLEEFPNDSFDIVCSKETLYHVPKEKKQHYLSEMYRVLKPGGILVIADWLQGTSLPGEHLKRTIGVEGFCHYVTPREFLYSMMAEANFQKVTFENVTLDHIQYTKEDIERIHEAAHQIQEELGDEAYDRTLKSWNLWLKALETRELMPGIFIGYK